jgi:aminoglycoside phosphotransferase family enzyme
MLQKLHQTLGDNYKQATYMLKYLNAFCKATAISKKVVVFFNHKGPVILYYRIEKGVITYCLSDITTSELSSTTEQNKI